MRESRQENLRLALRASYRVQAVTCCILLLAASAGADAAEMVGFTEPYRTVRVAAADSGIISRIVVREGTLVQKGQVLGELDHSVLKISLEISRKSAEAVGARQAAAAQVRLRREMLRKLNSLRTSRAASQEEVDRAAAELEVAEANLLSTQEALEIRQLEQHRVQAEIERRRIRSPIDGVVIHVFREPGEFTSPNDPDILTVVQLDPLLATFSVDSTQARGYQALRQTRVVFSSGDVAEGTIEYVSPVTDAESGTVEIRVRIDNPDQRYRSGERCVLQQ